MQREYTTWQDEKHSARQALPIEGMTQNTFCATASRAFQAVLKLSAMCSDKTRADLQAAFNMSCAHARGAHDDPDSEEEEGRVLDLTW